MMETRRMIVRSFALTPSSGDGRTIVGRCVPYGEPATVDDGQGPYREMFARGAFRRVMKAPSKVLLDFEHKKTSSTRWAAASSSSNGTTGCTACSPRSKPLPATRR